MQNLEFQRRRRLLLLCAYASVLAAGAVFIAKALLLAINLFTNLFYFREISLAEHSLSEAVLNWPTIFIPAFGGLIVGLMARYGSTAIRGHGIPEAMEKILVGESRIPRRMTVLKPLSSAIAIGSGGPFGAEGPIIATGGAVGSWMGQLLKVSAAERKILLASGAAAGMTAIFATPFAAVLLAIELLLFEFRAKSFIPVALAAVTAATLRYIVFGPGPVFPMENITAPSGMAMSFYVLMGFPIGLLSIVATKSIYAIEDRFEELPIHWMWWPAIGGLFVGLIGLWEPRSLGVGYDNIASVLTGHHTMAALVILFVAKFLSWSLALGSGTSGGTLAPLLTLGGAFGYVLGEVAASLFPHAGINPHVAALVGMAGLFAGASRALLTSVILAFELTRQPIGLLPLLGSCSSSYLLSAMLMENSMMTEKIVRRGIHVPHEYYPRETLRG
jgi:CIC family chloride channel protein